MAQMTYIWQMALTWSTAYRTNLIFMLKENTIQICGSEV
jgi:hypothetical protein